MFVFFFNDTATTEIYTLSLHDALPISIFYVVISTGIPLTSGLRAIEQSRIIFLSASWMVLFSVVTAYPLTKYFGLTGVMGGITAESTIQMLILWLSLKKNLIKIVL